MKPTYLYLLSQIGQFMTPWHAPHSCFGVVVNNPPVLVLLPMAGKTRGLHLLKHPEVKLLSDDSPFIAVKPRLRLSASLGLAAGSEIPFLSDTGVINRMEFGPSIWTTPISRARCPSAEQVSADGARTLAPDCDRGSRRLAGLRAVWQMRCGRGCFKPRIILRSSGWSRETSGFGLFAAQELRRSGAPLPRLPCAFGARSERNASTLLDYARQL